MDILLYSLNLNIYSRTINIKRGRREGWREGGRGRGKVGEKKGGREEGGGRWSFSFALDFCPLTGI